MLQIEPHTLKAHLQKAKALTHLQRLVEVYLHVYMEVTLGFTSMSQAEQCYCEAQKQCPDKAEFISSECTMMKARGLAGTVYTCTYFL